MVFSVLDVSLRDDARERTKRVRMDSRLHIQKRNTSGATNAPEPRHD